MKRIVLKAESEVKSYSKVDEHKYYSLVTKSGCDIGFITREKFGDGRFAARCFTDMTSANGWMCYSSDELVDIVKTLLSQGFKVNEFDTWQEMLAWALKQTEK